MEMERLIDRLSQLESELVKQRGRNSQARIVVTMMMTIMSIWWWLWCFRWSHRWEEVMKQRKGDYESSRLQEIPWWWWWWWQWWWLGWQFWWWWWQWKLWWCEVNWWQWCRCKGLQRNKRGQGWRNSQVDLRQKCNDTGWYLWCQSQHCYILSFGRVRQTIIKETQLPIQRPSQMIW